MAMPSLVPSKISLLLSVKAAAGKVYSPLGSRLAIETLVKYSIKYDLKEIVPYIERPGNQGMCPMEKLSIGKDPEWFYTAVKALARDGGMAISP